MNHQLYSNILERTSESRAYNNTMIGAGDGLQQNTHINHKVKKNETNNWSGDTQSQILKLTYKLKYNRIINNFFYFELKRIEQYWSWIIIILSAFTSLLSLLNNIQNDPFVHFKSIVQGSMVIGTTTITLIASWMKKQQYVVRINEIDRYLQRLNTLIEEIMVQMILNPKDRMNYDDFKTKYLPSITEFLSTMPAMSPKEWKKTVFIITNYYPELIQGDGSDNEKMYPWFSVNGKNEKGKKRQRTMFGYMITYTYYNLNPAFCSCNCFKRRKQLKYNDPAFQIKLQNKELEMKQAIRNMKSANHIDNGMNTQLQTNKIVDKDGRFSMTESLKQYWKHSRQGLKQVPKHIKYETEIPRTLNETDDNIEANVDNTETATETMTEMDNTTNPETYTGNGDCDESHNYKLPKQNHDLSNNITQNDIHVNITE
jgi:hypothetical protein